MQILVRQPPSQYNVIAAVCCELHLPVGLSPVNTDDDDSPEPKTVRIVSVHLPTFRPAFEKGLAFDLDAGAAIDDRGIWYGDLAGRLLQQVKELDAPTVIAGDFNVPVESAFYRDYWSSYQNALSNVGAGLRYTKYTRLHGIRIDHVLTDGNWSIESAAVGPDLGGDHRPVIVDLSLTR
jgi:endonuclease/exonuclease/phosphatase family metal-dependent hydrolase